MKKNLITWDDSYNTGLSEIDEQHRMLFKLINKIWCTIVGHADPKQVIVLIKELEIYAEIHFSEEERLMQKTDYPDFEEHQRVHRHFLQRVNEEKAIAVTAGRFSLDILYFLQDWLLSHIKGSDMLLAKYVKKHDKWDLPALKRLFGLNHPEKEQK